MGKGYVEAVAAGRKPRFSLGLVVVAGLLLFFSWLSYYKALAPIPNASEGYQDAFRAARFGAMGWALFYAMLGLWLVSKAARGLCGLPSAKGLGPRYRKARFVANCVLLLLLTAGASEPVASPHGYADLRWLRGGAAGLVWLLFAVEMVPLVRKAFTSLRARASAFSFQRSTVRGSETGAVRIEGTVALGKHALEGGARPGKLVYRHHVSDEGHVTSELASFLLEADGATLFVDTVSDRTVVVPTTQINTDFAEIGEGDVVEVWGHISRPGGVYRGAPSRIDPGSGLLYIFQGSRSVSRRLMLAATVELAAAASFLAVGVSFAFYVFDLYLFLI